MEIVGKLPQIPIVTWNCDLESQSDFLVEEGKINLGFLVVEEKTIPWCKRKSIPY